MAIGPVGARPDDFLAAAHFEGPLRPLELASGLPPWCYSDRGVLEAEQTRLFRQSWCGLGRLDSLKAPGDYLTETLAGVPIVILRDEAGDLRSFANSCRHRGARLLEGRGRCAVVVCPFHGWSYNLDGSLKGAPHMKSAQGFAKADHGLIELRLAQRDGFVFLAFDERAGSLDDWLGDFSSLHAPWHLGELIEGRTRELEVPCNWKLYLDVFNEYYHLRSVHPRSIGTIYDPPDTPESVTGAYTTQFGTHQAVAGLLQEDQSAAFAALPYLEGRNRQGTRYSWVFPNFTFAASTDCVWSHSVVPLAPDRTKVRMQVCFAAEASELPDFEERAARYYQRFDTALNEDIEVLTAQQAGLSSPLARAGRFCPEQEPSVAAFARWYAGRLTAA